VAQGVEHPELDELPELKPDTLAWHDTSRREWFRTAGTWQKFVIVEALPIDGRGVTYAGAQAGSGARVCSGQFGSQRTF
jgi:hypothetical protein